MIDYKNDYLNKTFDITGYNKRSPKTGKSGKPLSLIRDVRVSSNARDTDVENLSYCLVMNNVNHCEFKPELFEPRTIKRIKNILNETVK